MAQCRVGAVVGLLGVVVGGGSGCTADNPAFGDEQGATGGGDDGADDRVEGADEVTASADDTTSMDDGQVSGSDESAEASDSLSGTDEETGDPECTFAPPVPFDVIVSGIDGAVAPSCDKTERWTGLVLNAGGDEFTLAACPEDACTCDNKASVMTFMFAELDPTPADLVSGSEVCIRMDVARAHEDAGCGVEWITLDHIDPELPYPLYMAASSAAPSWSLLVPPATLGERVEGCIRDGCPDVPGDYLMQLGGAGPMPPGASDPAILDPYGTSARSYEVHAIHARVDDDCRHSIAWAARHAGR
jgi:hypothetical protein